VAGPLALFDVRAKRVLALAQDESTRFNHGYIGPEHLLIGILRDHGTVAATTLNSLGVGLAEARRALEALAGRAPHQEFEEIVLSPESKTIIELAPDEARRTGAVAVGPEHVLLAMVREPGKAEAILQTFGVSLDAIRKKILGDQVA